MRFETPLPIDEVLDDVQAALARSSNAVLIAPPGAGKTTRVPLALLDAPWRLGGKILMLSPRRLAARAAAERMAGTLGEPVGHTVGYRMRQDSKVSSATQIEVITQGLLTRQLLADPELPGVAAILFDEFHERTLDGDTGLALALEAQAALRPDLRLMPMSATLDAGRLAALLGDAPVITSLGRLFPVSISYAGKAPDGRLEAHVAQVVRRALGHLPGSALVFLPGQAEISRVASLLTDGALPPDVSVHPLMGVLDLAAQRRAVAPAAAGLRKVVLATSIAETSLTIEGVRIVVDAGLQRRAAFDPGAAVSTLQTVRVSLASATQRTGRAGRLEPGHCIRLWDEAETRGLPAFDPPEITVADLAPLALTLAAWGTPDPASLRWLDGPPAGAWAQAIALLQQMGAIDSAGRLTPHGRALAEVALHPRLAHMLVRSATDDERDLAALVAAVLSEPGSGGRSADLRDRLRAVQRDRDPRSGAVRALAASFARSVRGKPSPLDVERAGAVLAHAFPDRVARARGARGQFLMRNGRAVSLPETDPLGQAAWLVVTDIAGSAERARLLCAAPIDADDVTAIFGADITTSTEQRESGPQGNIQFVEVARLGAITLTEKPLRNPPLAQVHAAWCSLIARRWLASLNWMDDHASWQARVAFLAGHMPGLPDVSTAALQANVADWLQPWFSGKARLSEVTAADIQHALDSLLTRDQQRDLDTCAPLHFTTPAGSRHAIDYAADAGPSLTCRVQELYGLARHPMVGPKVGYATPLTLVLLSPAHRPVQTTQDLPGFWRGSWAAVKAEMRGRYPRHVWPDDPAAAVATTRAKPRGT